MIDINLGGPIVDVGEVAGGELGWPLHQRRGIVLQRAGKQKVFVLGLTEFECTLLAQHFNEPLMLRLWLQGGSGRDLGHGVSAILETLKDDEHRNDFFNVLRAKFCLDCGRQNPTRFHSRDPLTPGAKT